MKEDQSFLKQFLYGSNGQYASIIDTNYNVINSNKHSLFSLPDLRAANMAYKGDLHLPAVKVSKKASQEKHVGHCRLQARK